MNKFILIITVFFLASPTLQAQSQDQTNRLLIEEYLQQSEKQKKIGLTMLAVGGGASLLGLVLAASSDDWDDVSFGGGIILMMAGATAMVVSVPILISSASKARQAAVLSVGTQTVRVINQKPYSNTYPALSISLPLNHAKK
jgi:hypothetical protein